MSLPQSLQGKCNYFRKHRHKHQEEHLQKCLQSAQELDDKKREREILAIIVQEKSKCQWRSLNHAMRKRQGGAPRRVLVEDSQQEGNMIEYNTQESVQKAI